MVDAEPVPRFARRGDRIGEVAIVPPKDHTPVIRSLDPSDFPTPTSRDEEFRFTPMSKLRDLHKGDVPTTGGVAIAVNKVPGATFELTSAKTGERQGFTDKIAAGAWASVESVSTLTISAAPNNAKHMDRRKSDRVCTATPKAS